MWGLVFIPLVSAEIFFNFTSCIADERSVIYWSNSPSDSFPSPISSIACNRICPEGYILFPNSTTHSVQCERCPRDTYNLGGGIRLTHQDWKLDQSFARNECYLDGKKHLCLPWGVRDQHLMSGSAYKSGYLTSQLTYYLSIVKTGKLEVKYKKQTSIIHGKPNGVFAMFLNGNEVLRDSNLEEKWITQTFELPVGYYKFQFTYSHYTTEHIEPQTAKIQYIEIRGTQYAELDCLKCVGGYSEAGSGNCFTCPGDTYFEEKDRSCTACLGTHYSLPGSVGPESCKKKQPCTENDYSIHFSACMNDKRVKFYIFNQPQICDSSDTVLPEAEFDIPCSVCNPGYFHKITQNSDQSECTPCPEGKALTETEVSTSCSICPAGTYAGKLLTYSVWTPLSQDFMNTCKNINGEDCGIHKGWISTAYTLTTGTFHEDDIEISLSRYISFKDFDTWVRFSYALESIENSSSYLSFSVDGVVKQVFNSSSQFVTSEQVNVEPGVRYLAWKYYHHGRNKTRDNAFLTNVTISGSDEGGAPECLNCGDGFVSKAGSSYCTMCGLGKTSDSLHTQCVKCPDNTINNKLAGKCVECPELTYPNDEKTACIGEDTLYFAETTFFIRNISKIQDGHGMCSSESMQKYCYSNFIGPVLHTNDSFYLSVLNPGKFYYPDAPYEGSLDLGYIYQVQHLSDITDKCNNLNRLLNLGTQVQHIEPTSTGVRISYSDGDSCMNSSYSSEINLRCDKSEYYGWPVLRSVNGCHYVFEWKTRFGCHVCTLDELERVETNCYQGTKNAMLRESNECIMLQDSLEWSISCSVIQEVVESTVFKVSMVALGCVLVLVGMIGVVYWRMKRKYNRLLEYRASPRT